ncbi:MAG: response regulator transcription factor [Gaiellaceae bacterium]
MEPMVGLRAADLRLLLEIARRLGEAESIAGFHALVASAVSRLAPAASSECCELQTEPLHRRLRRAGEPAEALDEPEEGAAARLAHENLAFGSSRPAWGLSAREHAVLDALRPIVALAYERVAVRTQLRLLLEAASFEELTERESEILGYVARGRKNSEIAAALVLSPRTVQKHLEHVFERLGVHTRTQAAAAFWQRARRPSGLESALP